MEIGIWLAPTQFSDSELDMISDNFDYVMMGVNVLSNQTKYWGKFAKNKRGISYRFMWRPDGENKDDVAQRVNLDIAENFEADFHYADEPYRMRDIYDIENMHTKLIQLRTVIQRKGKDLIVGEGWRSYKNRIFNQTAWSYYSTWFKFLWWWLKIPEWTGCYGEKNIRQLNGKFGIHHIWVHAEKENQWSKLYKLAKELSVPLFLYLPSRLTASEKISRINSFLNSI